MKNRKNKIEKKKLETWKKIKMMKNDQKMNNNIPIINYANKKKNNQFYRIDNEHLLK